VMDRLSEIEERLANATPGPWVVEGLGDWVGPIGIPVAPDDGGLTVPDAELIAHAPADLAALVAVVREVEALHRRRVERPNAGCLQCGQIWPCPTAAAVQKLGEA
jgi:hypothetical protein